MESWTDKCLVWIQILCVNRRISTSSPASQPQPEQGAGLFLNTTLQNSIGKLGLLYCTNDVKPEIQIWADQVVAASWTRVLSPWKWAEMLSELTLWPPCDPQRIGGVCQHWIFDFLCSGQLLWRPAPYSGWGREAADDVDILLLTHRHHSFFPISKTKVCPAAPP